MGISPRIELHDVSIVNAALWRIKVRDKKQQTPRQLDAFSKSSLLRRSLPVISDMSHKCVSPHRSGHQLQPSAGQP